MPFASSAWPGCLNYSDRFALEDLFTDEGPGDPLLAALRRDERNRALDNPASSERRVALVESAQRDALVYAAEIPDRLRKLVPRFQKALADLAPAIEDEDQDFTRFALGFAERTLGRLLERQVCYFDLNRVIAGYLLRALPERGHPLAELLLRPTLRESVLPALGPGPLFYAESVQSGRPQMVGLHATGHALEGKSVRIPLEPTPLTAALAERRLCPGLGLTFVSLAFVNGFRCLGSFDQLEYLGRFKSALASLGWPPPIAALLDDPGGLTTGRALGEDGRPIHPLDVVLGAALRFEPESPLREWIEPLLPRLLQR